jgi:hypothetical protein
MSESYTVGGDTLFKLEPPKIVGQTFSPLQEHNLEFIDLNLRRRIFGGEISCTLYDLTEDPNMIGGGISYTKRVDWPERWFWQVNRVRFKMGKVAVHPGFTYGILIRSTPAPAWNFHYVQYDAGDATYPRGQRFTKDGRFDAPTYYPNDDLIFAEFGDPPLPPTPPDPPINPFAILDVQQEDTREGIKFIVTTNVPCHLYMLWTNHEPWTHPVPGIRRGAAVTKEVRYCFVDWISNQQIEPGDTMYHTFIKEPWAICETRWFTFKAKVNDEWSPSVGPVFKKHRVKPPAPQMFCQRNESNVYFNSWYGPNEWACPFKPTQSYIITQLGYKWAPILEGYPPPDWMRYCIYANGPDNKPSALLATTGLKSPPWPTDWDHFTLWDLTTPVTLQAGVNYWHVLHAGSASLPGYPYIYSRWENVTHHETCPSDITDPLAQRRRNDLVNPPGPWKNWEPKHEYLTLGTPL